MKKEQAYKDVIMIGLGDESLSPIRIIPALFDTGASDSVISEKLAKEMFKDAVHIFKEPQLAGTSNKEVSVRLSGIVSVIMDIDGCKKLQTIYTSPDVSSDRMILGRLVLDSFDIEFTDSGPRPKSCDRNEIMDVES